MRLPPLRRLTPPIRRVGSSGPSTEIVGGNTPPVTCSVGEHWDEQDRLEPNTDSIARFHQVDGPAVYASPAVESEGEGQGLRELALEHG